MFSLEDMSTSLSGECPILLPKVLLESQAPTQKQPGRIFPKRRLLFETLVVVIRMSMPTPAALPKGSGHTQTRFRDREQIGSESSVSVLKKRENAGMDLFSACS